MATSAHCAYPKIPHMAKRLKELNGVKRVTQQQRLLYHALTSKSDSAEDAPATIKKRGGSADLPKWHVVQS